MNFDFQYKDGYMYIFTASDGEDDSAEPTMQYVLNADTYTLEVGEQYSPTPEVYVLPNDMDIGTHTDVFQYLYTLAYAGTVVGPAHTLESVLQGSLQEAELDGNTLRFDDEWEICVDPIGLGVATVQYMRCGKLVAHKDVLYEGRRKVENVLAVLFPERFAMDMEEERELAITELEYEVKKAKLVLEQKERELKELKGVNHA